MSETPYEFISDHDLVRGIADRVCNSRQDFQSAAEGDFSLDEVAALIGDSEALVGIYWSLEAKLAIAEEALREIAAAKCNCDRYKDGSHTVSCQSTWWTVDAATEALSKFSTATEL